MLTHNLQLVKIYIVYTKLYWRHRTQDFHETKLTQAKTKEYNKI